MCVLKKMAKKLKSNSGFTLVEMLVALAIVVMMSLMMSVGASVGAQVQRESTFVAESDVLSSTINTALSDVLRYAKVRPMTATEEGATLTNEQKEAEKTLLVDTDGNKCLIDTDGYGVGGGAIYLQAYGGDASKLRLAISQYVTRSEGEGTEAKTVEEEKIYYLVSHGLYTNLQIMNDDDHKFQLTYIEEDGKKYFQVHYWVAEKRASNPMTKEVEAYFRIANE